MARSRTPFSAPPPAVPQVAATEKFLQVCPEPAMVLDVVHVVHAANAAAEAFLRTGGLVGKTLDEFLQPAGYEHEGETLGAVIAALAARSGAAGVAARFLVRRHGEEVDRLASILGLADEGGRLAGTLLCLEGGAAREDLVQLRAQAREAAHALNNIVMTAVGNISLSRLYLGHPAEASKHIEAAERNLLQVREVTRELQNAAKKDLPPG